MASCDAAYDPSRRPRDSPSVGLGPTSSVSLADVLTCPACGQPTDEADPTPAALRSSLNRLRGQLENLAADRPSQRDALQALDAQPTAFREELASAEAALNALKGADRVTNLAAADSRDFTRGRIDAILARVESVDEGELRLLRASVGSTAATVTALEAELDDDEDREQLTSRLLIVGSPGRLACRPCRTDKQSAAQEA